MSLPKLKDAIDHNKNSIPQEGSANSLSPRPLSPRRQKLIILAEKLMIGIGISGQTLFYLQAYKIYSMGSAKDVSAAGFSFALFSLVCWLLYGLLIKNKVLIIVNILAVLGASLTLLAILLVS